MTAEQKIERLVDALRRLLAAATTRVDEVDGIEFWEATNNAEKVIKEVQS